MEEAAKRTIEPGTCGGQDWIEQELAAKFHDYADPVLRLEGALALRDAVRNLDTCANLGDFARLLAARPASIR